VRFSFRVFKDSAAGSIAAPLLTNIDSVSVRDSMTAVVWFHTRTPDEFYTATYSPRILPAHLLDTIAPARWRTSAFGRAPVGSGPYRFARWAPGTSIELVADTMYRAGRPTFDRILFTITRDPAVAVTRLLAHETDFLDRIADADVPRVGRAFVPPAGGIEHAAGARAVRGARREKHGVEQDRWRRPLRHARRLA